MKKEQKELLLKDLSARLPYGVKLGFYASATKQTYICTLLGLEPQEDEPVIAKTENGSFYMLAGHVKPYLFPLSSMTEEQHKEFYDKYCWNDGGDNFEIDSCSHFYALEKFEWLDKNHFDYRGLIPMGLAIDATNLNIY